MNNFNLDIFSPNLAQLQEMVQKYKGLKIQNLEDKTGLEAVKEGKKILQNLRIEIQKTGKKAREEALAFQKGVIAQEKEYVSIIEEVEGVS